MIERCTLLKNVKTTTSDKTTAGSKSACIELLSGWINVDDMLPAIGQTVILFANGVVQKETYVFDAADVSDYSPLQYFWSRDDLEECPLVESGQFWMLLPGPPTR